MNGFQLGKPGMADAEGDTIVAFLVPFLTTRPVS
jgi:hypothetical protein